MHQATISALTRKTYHVKTFVVKLNTEIHQAVRLKEGNEFTDQKRISWAMQRNSKSRSVKEKVSFQESQTTMQIT